LIEFAFALPDEVEQPAGCGHQNIQAGFHSLPLPAIPHAAKHDSHTKLREAGEIPDGSLHLGGQFAGWFEHQRPDRRGRLVEFGEDGQGEGGRFARAGLGAADDIPSFQNKRYGAQLNGRGLDKAHRFDSFDDVV